MLIVRCQEVLNRLGMIDVVIVYGDDDGILIFLHDMKIFQVRTKVVFCYDDLKHS